MRSLVPEHLHSYRNIVSGRIEATYMLASVINYLNVGSWPAPAKPFVQMMITFLEREHLKQLRLARQELGILIQDLETTNTLEKEG